MGDNKETFIIFLKDKQFLRGLVDADKKTEGTKKRVQGLSGAVGHLRSALAGVSIAFLGNQIISTLADFERFEAVLTNTLGSSSAAQKAMAQINEFAAKTPFAVDKLTGSYVKLANQGFVPTQKEMTKLGDLASSTGKDFDQLTEALIDGQVGEFERLKEFGIRAKKEGDNVKFTFKGVTKDVAFTEKAMRGYILSLGDVQGVSGSMAAISKTTGGQISNLGDAVTQLFLKIGTNLKPVISGTIKVMGVMVSELGNFTEWLGKGGDGADVLFTAIGALGGAFLAFSAYTKVQAAWTAILTAQQWLLNAALTANPIGIIVVAIGALVGGLIIAWNSSEKFRGIVLGLWETMKFVGSAIKSFFAPQIEFIGVVFGMVKDKVFSHLSAIKTFVFDVFGKIMSFIKPIMNFLGKPLKGVSDSVSKMLGLDSDDGLISKIKDAGTAVKEVFNKGYNAEIAKSAKEDRKDEEKKELEKAVNNKITQNDKTTAGGGKAPKGLGAGIAEVKASAPKTFNINIESLIKEQVFKTENLKESTLKIKEAVTNVLLTAVTDMQIVAE